MGQAPFHIQKFQFQIESLVGQGRRILASTCALIILRNLVSRPVLQLLKWVWPLMNRYRRFFVQTSTRPPNMHLNLTKHGKFCKQTNQLLTKSHDELKDNCIVHLVCAPWSTPQCMQIFCITGFKFWGFSDFQLIHGRFMHPRHLFCRMSLTTMQQQRLPHERRVSGINRMLI